ncbi:MAG: PIG-L family deacetylase [Candidatus Omnitrophota bacterium]
MNVLAIGAHPDDIEYGCGGTLLKLAVQQKANVYFFIATQGELGGTAKARVKEQEEAADFLGVKKIFWGGFKDTELTVGKELIGKIEEAIRESDPDVIFVNYPDDEHQDHRYLAEATIVAARYARKVIFYEDYTCKKYEPHLFVDIGDVLEEKIKLMKFHKSQVERDYPTRLDMVESVKAVANFRGFQAKVKYAEGFCALRYLLDTI